MKLKLMLLLIISPFLSFSQCISGDCENGVGVYITTKKTKIDGHWKNGKPDGQCSMFYANGNSYIGEMIQGKRNGKGILKFADGYSEEGNYQNDTLSGFVTIKFPKGSIYVGYWKNNMKSGSGKYTNPNGYVAEGKFVNDTLEGNVTIEFGNGEKYIGEVVKGIENGKGVFYFKSGDKYEGEFKDGYPNGTGVQYFVKGGTLRGVWVKGEYISGPNTTDNSNTVIPFLNDGGVYEVNLNINSVLKLDMIFDTGAGEVQFSRDVFLTLVRTKTITIDDLLEGAYYEDANGNVNYNVRFNLKKMQIGNYTLENIPCCVAKDERGANLLGLSAIKKLGKFAFDFEKGIIEIN